MPKDISPKKLRWYQWRFYKFLFFTLVRKPFTAHYLAFTVTMGIFGGLIIPFGQMFVLAFLRLFFRGRLAFNLAIACVITYITNPFTYLPIWSAFLWIGIKISPEANIDISSLIEKLKFFGNNFFSLEGWSIAGEVLGYYYKGCFFIIIPSCLLAYFFSYYSIRVFREKKKKKMS